jgi:hypothetical protein
MSEPRMVSHHGSILVGLRACGNYAVQTASGKLKFQSAIVDFARITDWRPGQGNSNLS